MPPGSSRDGEETQPDGPEGSGSAKPADGGGQQAMGIEDTGGKDEQEAPPPQTARKRPSKPKADVGSEKKARVEAKKGTDASRLRSRWQQLAMVAGSMVHQLGARCGQLGRFHGTEWHRALQAAYEALGAKMKADPLIGDYLAGGSSEAGATRLLGLQATVGEVSEHVDALRRLTAAL